MPTESELENGGIYPRGFSARTKWRWPLVKSKDLVSLNYGKALREPDRRAGAIPVYGTNGRCGWHDTSLADGPGVVLGRKGQGPLGVEWCDTDYWVIDTAYFATPSTDALDLRYFYYLVKYIGLNHLKDGTSNPSLSRDTFADLLLPLPPLHEQRAITEIVRTLDDKIELNRRMNETLEAMARAIFKSWFVDFDPVRAKLDGLQPPGMDADTAALFPDHFEHVDGELLPQGWRIRELDECVSLIIDYRGKTPKKLGADWSPDGIPAISAKNVKTGRLVRRDAMKCVDEDLYSRWMKDALANGDTILTSEAPLGETYFLALQSKFCLSQRVYGIRANSAACEPIYLYHWLTSADAQDDMQSRATGTTVVGIRQSELRKVRVLVPPIAVQQKAAEHLLTWMIRVHRNEAESETLAETRDSLLPKLLSGEIRVGNAESVVGAVT